MARRDLSGLDEQFPHWCAQCNLTFLSQRDLELHLQGSHHKLTELDKAFLRSIKITPWEDDADRS